MLEWYEDCKVKVYQPYTKVVSDIILVGNRKELKQFEESLAKEVKSNIENMVVYKISNEMGKEFYVFFGGSRVMIGLTIEDWD